MADEKPSTCAAAPTSTNLIIELNDNDVLLGRGTERNEYIGNRRFRSLVEQHREAYKFANGSDAKRKVARKIIDQIHELGGRFLEEVKTDKPAHDVEEGVWIEVTESIAIQKCMQALRDQNRERQRELNGVGPWERSINHLASPADSGLQSLPGLLNRAPIVPTSPLSRVHGDSIPMLSSNLHFTLPLALDEQVFLLPATAFTVQQQALINRFYRSQISLNYQIQNVLGVHAPTVRAQQGLLPDMHHTANEATESAYHILVGDSSTLQDNAIEGLLQLRTGSVAHQAESRSSDARSSENSPSSGEYVSAQALLSSLENVPRFTDEQQEAERAAMTNEERAEALTDLFGKQCAVDIHKNKKVRKDLDRNSIDFLVQQMRLELKQIPEENKRALIEAEVHLKCHDDEFSDARLVRFLRCEGMNVKVHLARSSNLNRLFPKN